jgi:hypothetical protein
MLNNLSPRAAASISLIKTYPSSFCWKNKAANRADYKRRKYKKALTSTIMSKRRPRLRNDVVWPRIQAYIGVLRTHNPQMNN